MAEPTLAPMATRVDEYGVLLLRPETEPVPESTAHERCVDMLLAGLTEQFSGRDDVAVHGRLAWFPDRDDTRIRLDPDVMVIFGRPQVERRSYRNWAEDGISPTVLLEVLSEGDAVADYRRRLSCARQYGVDEVVLVAPFDPGGATVQHLTADPDDPTGWRRTGLTGSADQALKIPRLGVEFAGGDDLVVRRLGGGMAWRPTHELMGVARRATARAEAEAARAEAEAARADRLAQALRAAGLDPDSV